MAAKTNAVRMVEARQIPYKLYEYNAPGGFMDGVSVAGVIRIEQERVFKTLVLVGSGLAGIDPGGVVGAKLNKVLVITLPTILNIIHKNRIANNFKYDAITFCE